jgi:hypothetical protein
METSLRLYPSWSSRLLRPLNALLLLPKLMVLMVLMVLMMLMTAQPWWTCWQSP